MGEVLQTEPGDRFLTTQPCGSSCRCVRQDHSVSRGRIAPRSMIAMAPYAFTFKASVKGRWLGEPLLRVFVKEFTYLPSTEPNHTSSGSQATVDGTSDLRVTLTAYIDELCTGMIRLQGREAECQKAGAAYKQILQEYFSRQHAIARTWSEVCDQIRSMESSHAVYPLLDLLALGLQAPHSGTLPVHGIVPQLLLRQKDILLHDVCRQEGRLFGPHHCSLNGGDVLPVAPSTNEIAAVGGGPCGTHVLQVLGCTLDQPSSAVKGSSVVALLLLHKPSGMPVHPSGRYRKNTVTSIMEDVLGGVDRARYHAIEHFTALPGAGTDGQVLLDWVSIVHKAKGFELLRIWVRQERRSTDDSPHSHTSGIPLWMWKEWKTALEKPSSKEEAEEARQENTATGKGSTPSAEDSWRKLFVVHRLDAATSGVLLFGLNSESASHTAKCISHKEEANDEEGVTACQKTYLARVMGKVELDVLGCREHDCNLVLESNSCNHSGTAGLPSPQLRIQRPIGCLSFPEALYWCPGASDTQRWWAHCRQQHRQDNMRDVASALRAGEDKANHIAAKRQRMKDITRGRAAQRQRCEGEEHEQEEKPPTNAASLLDRARKKVDSFLWDTVKSATTVVQLLDYDAERNESVVQCTLLTGRTHQIRVHLASVGHPIVGDTKYVRRMEEQCRSRSGGAAPYLAAILPPAPPSLVCSGPTTPTSLSLKGKEDDEHDVLHFYLREWEGQQQAKPVTASRQSCLCPEAIQLHAWRYTLSTSLAADKTTSPTARSSTSFEAPPPPELYVLPPHRMSEEKSPAQHSLLTGILS